MNTLITGNKCTITLYNRVFTLYLTMLLCQSFAVWKLPCESNHTNVADLLCFTYVQ